MEITNREILGTIYECKKVMNSEGDNIVALFEHEKKFQNDVIQDANLIKFDNVNKYAYFKQVNSLLESTDVNIIDNAEIQNFFIVLNKNITELENDNIFNKFDTYNDIVKKTLLFSRQKMSVLGFNLFDIDKVINPDLYKSIKYILFNKTDKQYIILISNELYIYDIKTNSFGPYNNLKNEYYDNIDNSKIPKKQFIEFVKTEINNNFVVIYDNKENYKYTDNLFNDNAILNKINSQIAENIKRNSVIKS